MPRLPRFVLPGQPQHVKERMKQELNRPVQSAEHGGERKSEVYLLEFQRV